MPTNPKYRARTAPSKAAPAKKVAPSPDAVADGSAVLAQIRSQAQASAALQAALIATQAELIESQKREIGRLTEQNGRLIRAVARGAVDDSEG